jgi:hypothetical protein
MNKPEIKIIAVSNVYCRLMHFVNVGDFEIGHWHTYDHGTLISSGEVLVEQIGDNGEVLASKVFTAPALVFVPKNFRHKITATKENTVAACIHAMRSIDGNLLSPDFLVDEKSFADKWEESDNINDHYHLYTHIKRGVTTERFSLGKNPDEKNKS